MQKILRYSLVLFFGLVLSACGDDDDDIIPTVSITDVSVAEGNNLVFNVTLNANGDDDHIGSLTYTVTAGTATAGVDYDSTVATGTLLFPFGTVSKAITVPTTVDTLFENDETLTVTLSSPVRLVLGAVATATGTITNDDVAPTVSIAAANAVEGTNLDFTVTLSAVSGLPMSVDAASADGTAIAGSDYELATGTLTIDAGVTTGIVTVATTADTLFEADETLTVTLSNPTNAALGVAGTEVAIGTITTDETAASNVALTVSSQSLDFSWTAGANVDHYRLLVDADGASGFTVVPTASNIASTATSHSLQIPVHLTDWLNAQYILESCDVAETACAASPNQTLTVLNSVAATVYAKASNPEANDQFGWSMALSSDGNTLAVGANVEDSAATGIDGAQTDNTVNGAGAVYVFSRDNLGTWTQQAYVKASNTGVNDQFGWSMALSSDGNTLAVGANLEDSAATGIDGAQVDNTANGAGAVYVFSRTAAIWTQQAYVKASNTEAFDSFGRSVTLSGDGNTLAVGAFNERSAATGIDGAQTNNTADGAGAVYVFSRTATAWSQQAYVKASNTEVFDQFGWSVALSSDGNTLAVGANDEDSAATGIDGAQADNAAGTSGAVYVFTRTAAVWIQQAYVKASNTGANDRFGQSVALSGDGNTLAVGGHLEDSSATGIDGAQTDNTASQSGAVYVFTRDNAGAWSQQAYVKASNTGVNDQFGQSVALSGDGNALAVGVIFERSAATGIDGAQADNTAPQSGAVYIFSRTVATWMQQAYVKASNTEAFDSFGQSVTLSGDGNTLAVGARGEASAATGIDGAQTDNTASQSGAVYLY